MYLFRLATAGQVLPLGAFVSSSDGFTVVSTGTMANTDIKIQKHNSTAEVSKNSGGGTHISGGRWYCTLDATDTDTAGRLQVSVPTIAATTFALQNIIHCYVLPANTFDGMFYTSAVFGADMIRVAGSSTGANAMSSSALSTIYGTAVSTVSTPTVSTIPATMEIAMVADGQLQNRQMIFDRATATSGLREQAAQVSTWTAATSTFVVSPPFSVTPVHGDTFRIF